MNTYYTVRTPNRTHKPTYEEMLFVPDDQIQFDLMTDETSTTTRVYKNGVSPKILGTVDFYGMLSDFKEFNKKYNQLRLELDQSENMPPEAHPYYNRFYRPKKSGGLRPIDQPLGDLKDAQKELTELFLKYCPVYYHTTAFAYITKRCTVDCVKKHQQNKSWWFLMLDCKSFFPNTSLDFVMQQLTMIFPFSELCKWDEGKEELAKATRLGFLRGGLPQGTPFSPLITNIMMIPIDHTLNRALNDFGKQHFVYTRYADDIFISSKYDFSYKDVIKFVVNTFKEFNTPFWLNDEKTSYLSKNGPLWMLGLKLNKDNNISLGYREKKTFKAMINNFALDHKNDIEWKLKDLRRLDGIINYYHMVEPEYTDRVLQKHGAKYGVDVKGALRKQISIMLKRGLDFDDDDDLD